MSRPAAHITALCAALPLPVEGDAGVPDFIHLLPAGELQTMDGRGPYRIDNPDGVIRASMLDGARLPVDENHATDLAAPQGQPAPARGWIVALELRADGIWGRVEWTSAGRQLVADRAYRGISPALAVRKDGTVLAVLRASLVNNPNLRGLVALHAEGKPMDWMAKLRKALGLKDDADEAAIVGAVETATTAVATHATLLVPIAKAVGLPEGADQAAVLHAVTTLADPAKTVPATAFVALQQQFADLSGTIRREKAETAVDAAIKAGKIVAPAVMRDHYIARHMADPVAVDKELGAMVSLHSAGGGSALPPKLGTDGKPVLDGDEARIVALMGISPEAYAKTKAAQAVTEGAA